MLTDGGRIVANSSDDMTNGGPSLGRRAFLGTATLGAAAASPAFAAPALAATRAPQVDFPADRAPSAAARPERQQPRRDRPLRLRGRRHSLPPTSTACSTASAPIRSIPSPPIRRRHPVRRRRPRLDVPHQGRPRRLPHPLRPHPALEGAARGAAQSLFGMYRNPMTDDPSVKGLSRGTANTQLFVSPQEAAGVQGGQPAGLHGPAARWRRRTITTPSAASSAARRTPRTRRSTR